MRLNALNFAINRLFTWGGGNVGPSLIAQLFTPGTAGFCGGMSVTEAYDAGMMFQDSAGTTPAALNQPVGLVLGQVGSINASQTTSTKRPTLKDDGSGHLYLLFDGVDDCLVTPSIDMTGTDKVTVFAGVRNNTITSAMIYADFGLGSTGSFVAMSGIASFGDIGIFKRGNGTNGSQQTAAKPSGTQGVLSFSLDLAGATPDLQNPVFHWNGANAGTIANTDIGNGVFGNRALTIGSSAAGDYPLNGRMYTLPIIVGRAVEPALIAEVEAHINASMGGIY